MKYTWDLDIIYKNKEDFLKSIEEVKKISNNLKKYKTKLLTSNLYDALKEKEKENRLYYKIYVYAELSYNASTTKEENKILVQKTVDLSNYLEENDSWFSIELNKITKNKFNELKKENDKLKLYDFYIEQILRNKKHTLTKQEELLLSKLNICFNNSEKIFSILNNTDCFFEDMIINNKKYELNHSTFSKYIKDENRELRKQTFINYFDYYKKHKNTIAEIYISYVKANNKYCKIRKYKGTFHEKLYEENIDEKVFNNIIEVTNDNIGLLQKYINIKKKESKIKDYNYYDLYYNKKNNNKKYDIETAKKLIINSLKVLGKDYIEIINKAFDQRWIDLYYKEGKKSGAFSFGSYDTYPYILLNYEEDYNSVSTLIHELGHSVHTYYSNMQPFVYSNYSIFAAEIASTVNELLLVNYILRNSEDKNEKLDILKELLESFRTTIFRQVMFSEFEKEVNKKAIKEEELTEKILSDLYLNLTKKYYKDTIEYFDNYKYEWARIPHFYTPFYVYKYATGFSIACVIVNDILNGKENAKENYKNFLKSGGKDYTLNILKENGYNLNNKKIFETSMKMFERYINEYEKLINNK